MLCSPHNAVLYYLLWLQLAMDVSTMQSISQVGKFLKRITTYIIENT
jgi:hypothetical protein